MTCDQAELRMADLLLGELPAGERTQLERHLLDCVSCRRDFELARAGARLEWADVPVPPALIESTLASLREVRPAARFFRWATAAAALVGVAILLVNSSRWTKTPASARAPDLLSCASDLPATPPLQTAACEVDRPKGLAMVQEPLVGTLRAQLADARTSGKGEEAFRIRRRLGELGVQEDGLFDLKVLMSWDARSDVDWDVLEPDGTSINHQNRVSKIGGVCLDHPHGSGPETYTLFRAAPGRYRVGAHLRDGGRSVVKVVTILYEGTPKEERREETLVLEKVGESTHFIRDIVIP